MTGEAELVLLLNDHPRYVAAVGVMAIETHPSGKGHMIDPSCSLFLHEVSVTDSA